MTDPIAGLFGQLVMSGWIGVNSRDQRDMSFVYLGSPGGGGLGLPVQEVMPMLAEGLGLNPTPGAFTEGPTADTQLRLGSFGAELRYPGGTYGPRPVSDEWRQVAARRGQVVLALSYLPWPAGVDAEQHCPESVAAGQFALGLIPVRS